MKDLDRIAEGIRAHLDEKYRAREQALSLSREVIRTSANAIRAVHREEFKEAAEMVNAAEAALRRAVDCLADHPDILYAGFIHDAAKEFAEASITLAVLTGATVPGPKQINVSAAAYLNGLAEAVGELRRHLLDYLRRGELQRCEDLLSVMDDIYGLLVTIDYPDAITGGLRRTTDIARGILEKTRGDLTVASRQRDLELTLRDFERRFAPHPSAETE